MSGMVNTIVKNYFKVDLNFHPIRVIRFRNSDPALISPQSHDLNDDKKTKSITKNPHRNISYNESIFVSKVGEVRFRKTLAMPLSSTKLSFFLSG